MEIEWFVNIWSIGIIYLWSVIWVGAGEWGSNEDLVVKHNWIRLMEMGFGDGHTQLMALDPSSNPTLLSREMLGTLSHYLCRTLFF